MLRALINLFRSDDPLAVIGNDFTRMMRVTFEMTVTAGGIFFTGQASPETRKSLYQIDIEVNRLERSVRKRLVAHLSIPDNRHDVPHCLAMMSLVKDVERLGDYAKNLAEIIDLRSGPLPDDEIVRTLSDIRAGVESSFEEALEVFAQFDRERAIALIQQGRDITRRCETLLARIARSTYDTSTTTALVLGTRYYKRIAAHVLNVLSAVVMPLHKLDYYDEDAITIGEDTGT
ncbi:MAG TPA: PhoU domain-containing protein [Thermoanaerobaculia bacterium]|nr:PhoU domain-containing protein [Thermoanaerobaculia bacterium]